MENEIFEGLKNAISRGNTLQQAMMSFYNAGYKKEDIEEAARALSTPYSQPSQQPSAPQRIIYKQAEPFARPLPPKTIAPLAPPKQEMQLISKYESQPTSGGKLTTILLIATLVCFILVVIGVVMFYSEIMDFFKSLF